VTDPSRPRESLDTLVERYQRRVYAVIIRMTGRHADVDDLCQEVFLQAIKNLDRVRDQARLDSWIYRIALNVAYDHLRARTKARKISERLQAQTAETTADPDHAAAAELARAVEAALAQLPPDQRAVLVLRTFEGLGHEEIAAIQEVPVETVRWRLFAARRKLEELLSDYL
jgi:RNA polymerase sigma-70 factor (ECF subfamily)